MLMVLMVLMWIFAAIFAVTVVAPLAIAVGVAYLIFLGCGAIATFLTAEVFGLFARMLGFEPPGRIFVYSFWGILAFIFLILLPRVPVLVVGLALTVVGVLVWTAWNGSVPAWLIRASPWMN
jgi:hypothetical protein